MSTRDHTSTFIVVGVLIVMFGITFALMAPSARKAEADEAAATGAANTLLHALGRGDGAEACGVLTKPAATALTTQQGQEDCPAAVRDLADSLTAAERAAVAAMKLTDDDTRAEKRRTTHTVRLDTNPFGYTRFLVDRQDDEWRVIRME